MCRAGDTEKPKSAPGLANLGRSFEQFGHQLGIGLSRLGANLVLDLLGSAAAASLGGRVSVSATPVGLCTCDRLSLDWTPDGLFSGFPLYADDRVR